MGKYDIITYDSQNKQNKYRLLKSCDGDHLNKWVPEGTHRTEGLQRVPEGTDRTEEMARISGINQLGPQKLKIQVS